MKSWGLWPEKYPISFGFAIPFSFFHWVIIIGNISWFALIIAFTVFPKIYKYTRHDQLIVIPIAPDGKGGVSTIGDVSFSITMIMSCGMIFVISWLLLYGADLPLIIGFSTYTLFLSSIFFLPLLSVRWAMKRAKTREMQRFSLVFRKVYSELPTVEKLINNSNSTNSTMLLAKNRLEYLNNIDGLYRRVEAMPIWPFNFKMLRSFFSVIIIPLILFLVQIST